MSKKDTTKTTATATAIAIVRKSTKGVPRVNAGVAAMTPDQRKEWFDAKTKNCTAEQKVEVQARLDLLAKGGFTPAAQGKKIDFAAAFDKHDSEFLKTLVPILAETIKSKATAEAAEIKKQMDVLMARLNATQATATAPSTVTELA